MYATNNYLKMSASSSVSLKNGDDGDGFVKFPVISVCKSAQVKLGLWKKVTLCSGSTIVLVSGQTQFVGSEFRIFGWFGWVHSSILVDKSWFGRV